MKFCGVFGKEDEEMKMELWYNKQRLSYHKARKQQINKLVFAHKDLALAHANYITSIRNVGCSLLHFASDGDAHLRRRTRPTLPVQPSPDTSPWDFWTPSMSSSCRTFSRNNSSSGMEKIMEKVQKCFSTAADSGEDLPIFLGRPSSQWLTKKKLMPYRLNHSTTAEKMYDVENKLYQHVKLGKNIEYEKRMRKKDTESYTANAEKIEKAMDGAEKAIEAASLEIKKLSDRNLYGDVVKYVEGLMCMWKTMYECHQEQAQILLNYIPTSITNIIPVQDQMLFTDVKFEWGIKKELTFELERDVKEWMNCFCSLVECQRVYIASLNGWIRLINYSSPSNTKKNKIYALGKDWGRVVDRIPDKSAKEGIKHLLKTVRAIKVQEKKVHEHEKRCASIWKKVEKEKYELMCLECKLKRLLQESSNNNASSSSELEIVLSSVEEKRAKVAALMCKAEEEQHKSINLTRTTHSNLVQLGLPHTIQALVEFSSVCKDAFYSMYAAQNQDRRECYSS